MSMRPAIPLLVPALLVLPLRTIAATPFPLADVADEAKAASILWEHAPGLAETRGRLIRSDVAVDQAALWQNPELDLGVGTIPIGPLNPPDDPRMSRLLDVPNASIQLSQTFEIGKRGPRTAVARSARRAELLEARDALRGTLYELRRVAVEAARTQVQGEVLGTLAADARRLAALQQARLENGASTAVDVDRARLEAEQLEARLGETSAALHAALSDCALVAGITCTPFDTIAAARSFLATTPAVPAAPLETRPDVGALREREDAARNARSLALAKATPDVTVRAGYMHDRFLISGNQKHSLLVGVSLPLPVFDGGRVDARAADADALEASLSAARLESRASAQAAALKTRDAQLSTRLARLETNTTPMARNVVERLDGALARGGTTLAELLLARRTLADVELETTDLAAELHLTRAQLAFTLGAEPPTPPALTTTTGRP